MVKAGLSRRVGLNLGGTQTSFFYLFGGNSWGDENRSLWLQVWFCFFWAGMISAIWKLIESLTYCYKQGIVFPLIRWIL